MRDKNDILVDFLSTFAPEEKESIVAELAAMPTASPSSIGMLADAAADIPNEAVESNEISIVPIQVRIDAETVIDRRTAYELKKAEKMSTVDLLKAEAKSLDAAGLAYRLSSRFAIEFDSALAVCTHQSLVDVSVQLRAYLKSHGDEIRALRRGKGLEPRFEFIIHDSRSMFAGTALQALALAEFVRQGIPFKTLRKTATRLADHTHVLFVPGDTKAFGRVLKRVGDLTVEPWIRACSGLTAFSPVLGCDGGQFGSVDKAFNQRKSMGMMLQGLAQRVYVGLSYQRLLVSYGGELSVLRAMPEFEELVTATREMDVVLSVTHMGLASRALSTPGSLSAAYIATSPDSSFVSTMQMAESRLR
jgi:fatty acid-binding protein DegV